LRGIPSGGITAPANTHTLPVNAKAAQETAKAARSADEDFRNTACRRMKTIWNLKSPFPVLQETLPVLSISCRLRKGAFSFLQFIAQ
jgi:hypothetical protein